MVLFQKLESGDRGSNLIAADTPHNLADAEKNSDDQKGRYCTYNPPSPVAYFAIEVFPVVWGWW